MTIEAVVFDVGRVLFEWDLRHLIAKLYDDPQEVDWVLAHVVTVDWHFEHDAGRALADMTRERIARFPEHRHAIEAYAARFNETIPGPVPGSLELVEALHARDTPLYAITNFGAEFWRDFHKTQPIFTRFRAIVVSGEEKLVKPDPAIYALAAQRFGHKPEAMLFIDDNAENIASAVAEGWQGHHFSDAGKLERDLRARGLID